MSPPASKARTGRRAPRLRESRAARRERGEQILACLRAVYGEAETELDYNTPFELLISVILSAQATDVSVNKAAPALYARFPDAAAMARADPEDVIPYISSIGLYRSKAKNVVSTARALMERFNGEVPDSMPELLKLPGVGRKTANVVLGVLYGIPAIAVDTHVGRLARRLGLSMHENPDKVEQDLQQVFPREQWVYAHHVLILHGRRVCTARKPNCPGCVLAELCPSRDSFG